MPRAYLYSCVCVGDCEAQEGQRPSLSLSVCACLACLSLSVSLSSLSVCEGRPANSTHQRRRPVCPSRVCIAVTAPRPLSLSRADELGWGGIE